MSTASGIKAGEAFVEISGDDEKLKAATDRSTQYLKTMGKAAKDVSKTASDSAKGKDDEGAGKNWIERLALRAKRERMDDRKSGENALEKALSGKGLGGFAADVLGVGLPMVIMGAIGGALENVTKKAADLVNEFREGKKTAGEIGMELMGTLPIIGSFWNAGRNIREMITGEMAAEKRYVEETNQLAKNTLDISEAQLRTQKAQKQVLKEIGEEVARQNLKRQLGIASFQRPDEFTRRIGEEKAKQFDLQASIDKRIAEATQKIEAEFGPAIAAQKSNVKIAEAESNRLMEQSLDRIVVDDPARPGKTKFIDRKDDPAYQAKVATSDKELDNARKRVNELVKQRDARVSPIAAGIRNEVMGAIGDSQKNVDQIIKEQLEAVEKAYKEMDKNTHASWVDSMRLYLESHPEDMKAQWSLMNSEFQQKIAEIKKNGEDEKKRLGASPSQALGIDNKTDDQIRATTELYTRRWDTVQTAQFERERRQQETLDGIKIDGIANAEKRELAALDNKYKADIDIAKKTGQDTKNIQAIYDASRANMIKQQADKQADAVRDIDSETAAEKDKLTKRGITLRLAELERERQEALRKEKDERTKTGVGEDRINKLFDAKKAVEMMGGISSAGSFSATEFSRMGGAGTTKLDEIAKNTKDTAKNTKNAKPKFTT